MATDTFYCRVCDCWHEKAPDRYVVTDRDCDDGEPLTPAKFREMLDLLKEGNDGNGD